MILLISVAVANYIFEVNFGSSETSTSSSDVSILTPTPTLAISPSQKPEEGVAIATAILNDKAPTKDDIVSTPEFKATPLPTLLPYAVATLIGPPDESKFSLSSPVTFYWRANGVANPGQTYALYIVGDDEELLEAVVDKPNLGNIYQAQLSASDSDLGPGQYRWEVRLMNSKKAAQIGGSEQRTITFTNDEK